MEEKWPQLSGSRKIIPSATNFIIPWIRWFIRQPVRRSAGGYGPTLFITEDLPVGSRVALKLIAGFARRAIATGARFLKRKNRRGSIKIHPKKVIKERRKNEQK